LRSSRDRSSYFGLFALPVFPAFALYVCGGVFASSLADDAAHLARLRGDAPAVQREIAEAGRLYATMGATAQVERLVKEASA